MRTDRLQMLVDELRRGEFIQGRGVLRDPGRHCALGVACELFRRETNRGRWVEKGRSIEFVVSDPDQGRDRREAVLVPLAVTHWYLNDPHDRRLRWALHGLFQHVAGRNDRGVPFDELAELIEDFISGGTGRPLAVS